jgi:alkylation response protein AidB-like acyl-CoA dehydrogenase
MAVGEPGPLDRARAIAPLIAADALEGERLGRLTDKVAAALHEANLFSILRSRADGGLGGGCVDLFETVEAVAKADGAAGWCLSVCATVVTIVDKAASAEAKAEILGGASAALWTSLFPRATSSAVDGGYRVSGAFSMGSGSSLSGWVMVAAPLPDRDGAQWFRAHLLPKADVVIDAASWDVMGLRATHSVEYRVEDVFVPTHRTFDYPFIQRPESGAVSAQYGGQLNLIGLTAFASGVGLRAVAEVAATAAQTKRLVGAESQAEDAAIQHGLGVLEGRLRAARTHFLGFVERQDEHLAAHGYIDTSRTLEFFQAAQTLALAAREIAVFAFDHASVKAIFADHPLQRCVRDLFTGLKHASFAPAHLTRAGRATFGLAAQRVRFG